MDESEAALFKAWMDRTSTLEAQVTVLRVITAHLAAAIPPERAETLRAALLAAQAQAPGKSWEFGVALEEETARFLARLPGPSRGPATP